MFNQRIALLPICLLLALFCGEVLLAPQPRADSGNPSGNSGDVTLEIVPLNGSQVTVTNENKKQPSEEAQYWRQVGLKQLKKIIDASRKAKETSYKRKAKNIIIFIGDGMGVASITAGRIYKGQLLNQGPGEEEMLSFDDFPFTGMAKTYNVDKQVPDSAGTATALFTGVKAPYGAIGVDNTRSTTDPSKGTLTSVMDWAQAEGKRTGIVTTTRITHATPAATYARLYNRDWECDTKVPEESMGTHKDVARQLVENAPGNQFNVIMGGGLQPMGAVNEEEVHTVKFEGGTESVCRRGDNRNLVQEWLKLGNNTSQRVFVQTRKDLLNLETEKYEHVMGLFRNNHITYSIAREPEEPSLKEMTEAAIRILDKGRRSKGFVLLVEGGRIDQAHHQNYARAAMREVVELDMAVQAALEATDPEETLIIVTADHSHAVTLNGYPTRGNDILGFANKDTEMVYETLTYANGPGYYEHLANSSQAPTVWRPLESFSVSERQSPTYRHLASLPLKDETHGGEDVVVFAHGPGSSLVRGVFEQNYVAYVMSYAGCMGPAKSFDHTCSAATTQAYSLFLLLGSFITLLLAKI